MSTTRVAIIGLGRMGSTICDEVADYPVFTLPFSIAGACVASEKLELIAGADLLPEKRQAFTERWGIKATFEDFREMIEKESPDMVCICTKGVNHSELTVAVAELGVPMIFCEKAMACSMAEADAAKAAIEKAGSRFLTGVLRRWKTSYQEARKRIVAGDIGEPRRAIHFAQSSLLHGHVHSVDTLMFLLGDPKAESLWGELHPRDLKFENGRLEKDPTSIYQIAFEGGIEATTIQSGNWDFEIHGTEGVVRIANNGGHLSIRKQLEYSKKFRPFIETQLPPPLLPRSGTVQMLEDLVDANAEGRPTSGDIDQVHHCTEILFAIAECHHLGLHRHTLPVQNRELYVFHI